MDQIWRRRKFAAFLFTALAFFMLVGLFWSLKNNGFRVINKMQFRLNTGSEASVENFKKTLFDAMQHCTSDHQLVNRIRVLNGMGEVRRVESLGGDLDSIRSRIKVFTRSEPNTNLASVQIVFDGTGNEQEVNFIQRLSEDVVEYLGPTNDFTQVEDALSQVGRHIESHLDNQDQFSVTLRSLVKDVNHRLDHLTAALGTFPEAQNRNSAFRSVAGASVEQLSEKVRELERQKDELFLDMMTEPHEIESIDRQIAELRQQLDRAGNTVLPTTSSQTKFKTAGFQKNEFNAVQPVFDNEVVSQLQELDLGSVVQSIELIDGHRREDLESPLEFIGELQGNLEKLALVDQAAVLMDPGTVKIRPTSDYPSAAYILLTLLLAVVAGALVSANYHPRLLDRGFENQEVLSETLGVPLVSKYPLQSRSATNPRVEMVAKVVTLARMIVITVLVLSVVGLLFSSSVRVASMDSPLHGLARLIWMIKGN